MKRTTLALLAVLACLAAVLVAAPAQALTSKTVCSDDGAFCATMNFTKDPGDVGFYITSVVLTCDYDHYGVPPLGGFDPIAADGHQLYISNYNGVEKFYLGDADSNLSNDCRRVIPVNLDLPTTHTITFAWFFTEQLNHQHDIDDNIVFTAVNG